MAIIFDLTATPTTESTHTSPTVSLDSEMRGSRCNLAAILINKLRYTTLHMYFRLMAAIFDLPVTPTLETVHTSTTMLLDPENVRVAVEILLLATTQDLQSELRVFPVSRPPF